MPEGPEIRLAADEIAAAIVDKSTTGIFFAFDHLKKYEAELTDKKVIAVDTYGKGMLTRFENNLNIYSHNQLYGIWMVRKKDDYPDTKRQLRLAIHNASYSALLYSASDIEVLRDTDILTHPFLSSIGPDALHTHVTAATVVNRLISDKFKRRRLSSLLLDQRFLAGLGNYLRSEILFVARVSPHARPIDCTPDQINAIAHASLDLTRQSYATGGITNELALAEQLKAQGQQYRDYRFRVFNRDGRACYTCGSPIIKDQIGGRRLYYCPICQAT